MPDPWKWHHDCARLDRLDTRKSSAFKHARTGRDQNDLITMQHAALVPIEVVVQRVLLWRISLVGQDVGKANAVATHPQTKLPACFGR